VVWAIYFQFDATTDGRPIKIANVIDEHTRQALAGQVARSITGDDLGRIAARGRWPVAIRCDNGPELICQALADECAGRVGLSFIDPGCPWQNPYVESFHGRLRDECLNLHHFAMLLEAKVVIDDWRAEYNTVRPSPPTVCGPRSTTSTPARPPWNPS
jgi:transposase InsO family protein